MLPYEVAIRRDCGVLSMMGSVIVGVRGGRVDRVDAAESGINAGYRPCRLT
jgi:hypothetical protein